MSAQMQPKPLNQNRLEVSSGNAVWKARRFVCWCIGAYDGTNQHVIKVPLTRSEVVASLSRSVMKSCYASYYGEVTENTFNISVGHLWFGNSWWPILYGTIDEESDGCIITTHFDISPITKKFMTLWLEGSAVIALIAVLESMFVGRSDNIIAVFPLMLGLLASRIGHLVGEVDEVKLLDLLKSLHS